MKEAYWIVRQNKMVVAALAERYYGRSDLAESLIEMAETGPLERIITDKRVVLGEQLEV